MSQAMSRACPSVEASSNFGLIRRTIDGNGSWGYKNIVSIAFDPDKEARNIRKHGISLARAEEIDMAGGGSP
jgi:hypothetical protein